MKLRKIETIVQEVMNRIEETKSDDFLLVYHVYRHINENVATIDRFSEVMINHKEYGFPSWASITRTRRKVFEKNPSIKPKRITKEREKEEEVFREYARS